MAKEEPIVTSGKVTAALAGTKFRVMLFNGNEILCDAAGRLRKNFIKIIPGDDVTVELSQYDLSKGRITYRGRPKPPEEILPNNKKRPPKKR